MKKISFWIVIFICMADAALAVTQEGGLFYLPEDTTTQHKDSTVQKRTFFKKFLDYFNAVSYTHLTLPTTPYV